jgi:hypothetical protein
VTGGPGEIAERVVQALEAADDAVAGLPARAAGCVLIALGSSPGERGDVARRLAGVFRSDLVAAVESAVHRALLELGGRPGE